MSTSATWNDHEAVQLAGAIESWRNQPEVLTALGSAFSYHVLDAETGRLIAEHRADVARMGASCTKLLTAVAALTTFPTDHVFTSVVASDGGDTLFLRGGGDPWMEPRAMARLAARTVAGAPSQASDPLRVLVDEGLFPAFEPAPGWTSAYLPIEIQPVVPLSLREYFGNEPGRAAGEAFAGALTAHGLPAVFHGFGTAAAGAATVAAVDSANVAQLVEHMLQASHNLTAEVLNRSVAIARGQEPTWAGAATATEQLLTGLGLDLTGVALHDGSGLSRAGRVRVDVLTGLLRAVWQSGEDDGLRVIFPGGGLPCAGITGTMSEINDWFRSPRVDRARGALWLKPGTLNGTVGLAGVAWAPGHRPRVLAVLANDLPDVAPHLRARRQIERFAATVAFGSLVG